MDYFGFQKELYQLKFKSRGDTTLSHRIVDLYKEVHPRCCIHFGPTNTPSRRAIKRALHLNQRPVEWTVEAYVVNTICQVY
jgi:hypothetical protein